MKRNCLLLHRSSCFFAMAAIISCALLSFSATTAAAQANSVAPAPPISIEDLPQKPEWKDPVDYAAVIASERNNTSTTLSAPDLKDAAIALYTGYDRMLSYMQQDMINNVPIEEIAEKNYNKVVAETPSDPILVNMEASEFNALYAALLGMLHQ